jgi:hypothetical protein
VIWAWEESSCTCVAPPPSLASSQRDAHTRLFARMPRAETPPPFATHESLQKLCAYKREVTLLRKDTHKSTNATTSWFQSFAHAPRVGTVGLQNSASCDHVGESGGKVLGERSAQLLNSSLTSVASTATWARTPTTRTGLLPVSCMLFYFSYSWDHDAILVLLSCLEFIISHYQYTTCLVCFLYI